jgi:hypothetical protein
VIETRDKNSWYGVSFGLERRVTAPELRQAMAFKDLAASNQVKANLSDLSEDKDGSPGHPRAAAPGSAVPDDEIPF